MDKVLKLLEKQGCIDNLKFTEKMVPVPESMKGERARQVRDIARAICLKSSIAGDEELSEAFAQACFNLGMKELLNKVAEVMDK